MYIIPIDIDNADIDTAFNHGFLAHERGFSFYANPFKYTMKNSQQYKAWIDGWLSDIYCEEEKDIYLLFIH
jgi:hypothetical protein